MSNKNIDSEKIQKKLDSHTAIMTLCKDLVEQKNKDNKRLFIALIISLCVNVAIIGAFLWYESLWDYATTTTTETT